MYQEVFHLRRDTRDYTLRLIGGLSERQLQFSAPDRLRLFELPFLPLKMLSPSRPRWSVSEVADHLILFETIFRQNISTIIQLKKSGRDPVLHIGFRELNASFGFIPQAFLPLLELPIGTLTHLLPTAVVEFLIGHRLLPAQTPDVAAPRTGRTKDALCEDLRGSLTASEELFTADPNLDYRHMYRQHPVTGRLNVLEAVRIVALHEQRHQRQIQEILDDAAFPKS